MFMRLVSRLSSVRNLAAFLLMLALSSCGGGGGGGSTQAPATPGAPASTSTWDQMQWDQGTWG
jgi:hypothetical protein